ncbi:MAG: DUF3899 domain-containing protein [Bacilli bacterium]|nr:DUF3899 domain-containing protein [Bacilli bacterium]
MRFLRRLVINSAIAGLIFLAIMYTLLEGNFTEININNSLFVTGMVMLFTGILTATQALKIFRGFGYAFKKFFFKNRSEMTYYEYIQQKELIEREKEDKPTGWYALIVGLILIVLTFIIF